MQTFLKSQLLGNVGTESTIKEFANGKKYHNFSVAHNERWKDKNGESIEKTTWINCLYPYKDGSKLNIEKGAVIHLEGTLTIKAYMNEKGEPRSSISMNVTRLHLIGKLAKREEPNKELQQLPDSSN